MNGDADNNNGDRNSATVPERPNSTSAPTPIPPNPSIKLEELMRRKYLKKELNPPDLRVLLQGEGTGTLTMVMLHKEPFVIASPYFAELLCKATRESHDGTSYSIKLEMPPKVFQFIRHFLYTGDLPDQIRSNDVKIPPIQLDTQMQLKLLEASVKCDIDRLLPSIIIKIKQTISKEDAFAVLQMSRELEVNELDVLSLEVIFKNAEDLLSIHVMEFCALGHYDVCRILSSDSLAAHEVTVFNAALRWAKERAKHTKDPEERKKSLKYYFNKVATCIRFPLLSPLELAQLTVEENLLEDHDLVKLFQYLCLPAAEKKNVSLKFEIRSRNNEGGDVNRNIMQLPGLPDGYAIRSSLKRQVSEENDTDDKPAVTNSAGATLVKRVCFENPEETQKRNEEYEEDSSDEELFLAAKKVSEKPFNAYEDLSRRFLKEPKPREIGSVEFSQVSFAQPYRSVVFEQCKDFVLDATLEFIREESNRRVSDMKKFIRCFDPMRYLVFHTKQSKNPLTAEDIWSMQQNILLKFNGVTFLKAQHSEPSPKSSEPTQSSKSDDLLVLNYIRDSRAILSNDHLKPTTLAVSNCEFSSQQLIKDRRQERIETLILYHAWGDYTAEEIMRDYPNLQELVLWKQTSKGRNKGSDQEQGTKASDDGQGRKSQGTKSSLVTGLSINFAHVFSARPNIRKIVLFQSELKFPVRCTQTLPTVSELYLDHCHVSGRGAHISEVFPSIFPKLVHFMLFDAAGNRQGNLAKSDLVNCVRKNIKTIEWFRVVGLKWEVNEGERLLEETENLELNALLGKCNISANSTNFLLEKEEGEWKGKDYQKLQEEPVTIDGGYHSEMDQLEYDWYSLRYFFDSCQVFEDYFIPDAFKI